MSTLASPSYSFVRSFQLVSKFLQPKFAIEDVQNLTKTVLPFVSTSQLSEVSQIARVAVSDAVRTRNARVDFMVYCFEVKVDWIL